MPKHPGGRPSEYKPDYVKKVDEYLVECEDENVQLVKQANEEKGYEMFDNRLRVHLPTIEGFARFIGVNKTSLYEWEREHKEFSNALDKIRTEQHDRLINNGLSGDYNSTIAKLILSSNHGYAEKTEQESKVTLTTPLTQAQQEALNKLTLPNVDQASPEQSNNGDNGGTQVPV